jgi:acyl carrier protein
MNERLVRILSEVLGLREKEVVPDLKKSDVDNWDSLKQMDLVVSLEREFDLMLEIEDIVKMVSVGDIVAILTEKGISFED